MMAWALFCHDFDLSKGINILSEKCPVVLDHYSWLSFYLDENHSFLVEKSCDYSDIAHRGLRDSHALKVPFYNEVQS